MPFITQGKTNWKFLLLVIILAVIVGGEALWYSKRPDKPYQPVEVNKPETANLKNYQWNNLEFKYPSNWTVKKTYYETAAQQANGEPPVNIGLAIFPGTKSTGTDFISIGGHQVSCDPSENHTKCQFVSSISDFIYTDSNNPDILKVFDQMVPTLKNVEDETANWKIYRNEEYGFEFKYPPIPLGCEQCKISENSDGFNVNTTNFGIKDSGGLNLLDFVNKETEGFTIEKKEEMIIGGENGIAIDYRFGGTNRFGSIAFIEKDNKVFVFSFTAGGFCCNPSSDRIYESEVYNAMLSTFRFLKGGVSLEQLNNATYEVRDLVTMHGTEWVSLKNAIGMNSSDGMMATLEDQNVVFGDLNNDGLNDALVLLNTTKEWGSEKDLEMILYISGSIKTFLCKTVSSEGTMSFSIENGLVINSDKNAVFPEGDHLREAFKFDGKECVVGNIDTTTGKVNF